MIPIRVIVPLTSITDTFYMAVCRECGDEPRHGIPFKSELDRDEWCAMHESTGHRVERQIELHGRIDVPGR